MEEIMINSVDVSECEYYRMNNKMSMCTACNSGIGSPYCEYNPDCYYRQLEQARRDKQELENKLYTIEDLCQELVYSNKGMVEIPLILGIVRGE